MIEIQTQIRESCPICKGNFGRFYLPYGEESIEKAKEHKPNQIVTNRIAGIRKQRSVVQLNTYWACCQTVADNTEHKLWSSKKKVDFQCRVETDFRDHDVVAVKPDGDVVFQYLSISFPNLAHILACRYFDQAFEIMAKFLGVTPEKLIEMAKSTMLSY